MTQEEINKVFDCDIYSVEEQDGEKIVHVHGYLGATGERLYSSEQCWQMYPLEMIVGLSEDATGYISEDYMNYKNYEYDMNTIDKIIECFEKYDCGKTPQRLPYSELTMDTPCGCYYNGY